MLRASTSAVAALVLALSSPAVAVAGAPAPRPDTGGVHAPEHQTANLGAFTFESGEVIEDLKVSYVTHGRLNGERDNVILALQSFIGDHHDLDFLIGPGKALDPERYFIVAADFLANSRLRQDLTSGPTNSGLKMGFPRITHRDWVAVEHKLLTDYLGIDRVLAAVGASIGAQNAYQLAVSYPDFARAIVPIVGGPTTNPQLRLLARNMMAIIELDPGWYAGNYEVNPAVGVNTALMNMVSFWYTPEFFLTTLATAEDYRRFESFWHATWSADLPQDARDVYYQLRALAEFNVGETPGFAGDTRAALGSIKAKTLLIGATADMLIQMEELEFAEQAIPDARLVEIDTPYGHTACCGVDPEATAIMDSMIAAFLAELR